MPLARLIIITYALLFIPGIISEERNCADIRNPRSASDCIMSTVDKENYDYCCYIKYSYSDTVHCEALTYEDYQDYGAISSIYESFECNHAYSGCNDIKPEKASDCVLSQEDINRKLSRCCYEVIEGKKLCEAFNEEYYQFELEAYKIAKHFDSNTIFNCGNEESNSSFINISVLYSILILILII